MTPEIEIPENANQVETKSALPLKALRTRITARLLISCRFPLIQGLFKQSALCSTLIEALETEMHLRRPHLLGLDLVLPGITGVGA